MKSKAFFIIFEGLSLKQIKNYFSKGESPTLMSNSSTKCSSTLKNKTQ